jgi:hypothetical protein
MNKQQALRLGICGFQHANGATQNKGFATHFMFGKLAGAGGGNRTPDIQLGKLTFYL